MAGRGCSRAIGQLGRAHFASLAEGIPALPPSRPTGGHLCCCPALGAPARNQDLIGPLGTPFRGCRTLFANGATRGTKKGTELVWTLDVGRLDSTSTSTISPVSPSSGGGSCPGSRGTPLTASWALWGACPWSSRAGPSHHLAGAPAGCPALLTLS